MSRYQRMQTSPDGRITIQWDEEYAQYRVEFLDWSKNRSFYFSEGDMIDIYNRFRFSDLGDVGSWKLTRIGNDFLWQSKNERKQIKLSRTETDGLLDAYIRSRLWRRGEWPPYDWNPSDD